MVVAATQLEAELVDDAHARVVVCGIGPVEAAAATSRALVDEQPDAILQIGIAGAQTLPHGSLAIGSESVYCDVLDPAARMPRVERLEPAPQLLAAARRALPDAHVPPSATATAGTSATPSRRWAQPCRRSLQGSPMPELPAALPPGERNLGQFIAETIRTYGHDFWRLLPLGLPLAIADQLSIHRTAAEQLVVYWGLLPLFVAAYLWACRRIVDGTPTRVATAVAVLIWLPFPALRSIYILPGLAWLAFIGLAVPAAMLEPLRFRAALVRGRELGTADFGHALGSLAALVLVV